MGFRTLVGIIGDMFNSTLQYLSVKKEHDATIIKQEIEIAKLTDSLEMKKMQEANREIVDGYKVVMDVVAGKQEIEDVSDETIKKRSEDALLSLKQRKTCGIKRIERDPNFKSGGIIKIQ